MPKRISNVLGKVAFDPNSGAGAGHQYAKESEAKLTINNLARTTMQTPPLDPDIADIAPSGTVLTSYDKEHIVTYLRMLDAHAEGADWREIARVVLHLDPEHECGRARKTFDSHLSRAKWMTEHSYRHLLCGGASA
ncbi:hypothetical protein ABIF68_003681 [Bradyrhizobium japonicum]|jgi:hypothetical protein